MTYGAKLRRLRAHVNGAVDIENRLGGKAQKPKSGADPTPLSELLEASVAACQAQRKRKRDDEGDGRVDDAELLELARHTRNYALHPFRKFLHYVPRLVNVVSLAEAVPAPGSGVTLPLDVRTIASRCRGAFYAPSRFAAVQLAFSQPRSRILIFRTPRAVLPSPCAAAHPTVCPLQTRGTWSELVPRVPRRRAPPSSAPSASSPSKPASTYTSSPSKSKIPSAPSRSAPP